MTSGYELGAANLASRLSVFPSEPVNIASTKLARPSYRMPLGNQTSRLTAVGGPRTRQGLRMINWTRWWRQLRYTRSAVEPGAGGFHVSLEIVQL